MVLTRKRRRWLKRRRRKLARSATWQQLHRRWRRIRRKRTSLLFAALAVASMIMVALYFTPAAEDARQGNMKHDKRFECALFPDRC